MASNLSWWPYSDGSKRQLSPLARAFRRMSWPSQDCHGVLAPIPTPSSNPPTESNAALLKNITHSTPETQPLERSITCASGEYLPLISWPFSSAARPVKISASEADINCEARDRNHDGYQQSSSGKTIHSPLADRHPTL